MINNTQQLIDLSRVQLDGTQAIKLAEIMEKYIIENAPIRSGHLRSTVSVDNIYGSIFMINMAHYGWILNKGFEAFFMRNLEGSTVPITMPNGAVIFRKVRDVGSRRISNRDPKTGRIMAGNSSYSWRHPGIKPMRFIEKSIRQSVMEALPTMQTLELVRLLSSYSMKAVS